MAQPTSRDSLTLLLTISKNHDIRIGRPPMDLERDNYHRRAENLGKLSDVSYVFCNPGGELFCVKGGDLYMGPLPTVQSKWIDNAKIVGRAEWSQFKILLFHPIGELYGTTKDGDLYKGPQPDNPGVNWMCEKAKRIRVKEWKEYRALFFDAAGNMYTVDTYDSIVKLNLAQGWYIELAIKGDKDWLKGSNFLAFCSAGNLWCVNNKGNIYKTSMKDDGKVIENPDKIGKDFGDYRFLCFTTDKTIGRIISVEFLLEKGKVVPEEPEVLKTETYENKSTTVMKYSFIFEKIVKKTSTFTHAHGFQVGGEITFQAGIPHVGINGKLNLSTSHTLTWTKTKEIQDKFGSNSLVEVPPGKGIKLTALVKKAKLSVPYRAKVQTLFGFETDIEGMWNGVDFYKQEATQKDHIF